MPNYHRILNLPGFSIKNVTGYRPVILDIQYNRIARCGHCNSKRVRIKDSFIRKVKHEAIGHRQTILRFKAHKLYCNACLRYSNQQFPGIGKHQRATERLQAQIFHQHTNGIPQKKLANEFRLGKATVERWYQRRYIIENKELRNAACPTVLGIDEHFFSKKKGFATTFCNLRKHKVFDIVQGRAESKLSAYLKALPGKELVKIVCIDLSTTYRTIIKKYFPNAKIVADRFHVIRLMLHQCMMTYRTLVPTIKNNRGILAILKKQRKQLSIKQLNRQVEFFNKYPAVEAVYYFQQRMHHLLMNKTKTLKQCKKLIPKLLQIINELKTSGFKSLRSLGKTFDSWKDEIARMWRFSKSNGITEGFHRKMKLIQRQAYGFRNFENYRLRVRVLCS